MEKRIVERLVVKKEIKKRFSQLLFTIILLLIGMIIVKKNPENKVVLKEKIYEESFPFQQIKMKYENVFGNIFSIGKKKKEVVPVFEETVAFQPIESYENGIKVQVSNENQIPILESGVVIFIGEKEHLGLTIIVEQVDGTHTFYGNIESHHKKLYDYVEKGDYLGKAKDHTLYLAFQKDGKYLDYQKYI